MYRDPDGRQRSRSFSTYRDADRFLAHTQVARERGEWRDPKDGRRSFAEVAWTWRAQKAGLKPGTLANYDVVLRNHLIPHFGETPIARISPSSIRVWVGSLRALGIGEGTVAKAFRILDAIMDMAVDDQLIASSPVPKKLKPSQPDPKEMMFLNREQVADLSDAIRPHYRPLILTAAHTGLRWGELAGLKVGRVDLLHRTIRVTEQLVDLNGRLSVGTPKSKAGKRTVDLPGSLIDQLREAIGSKGPDELVFTAETGGPLRRANFRKRVWLPALQAAGLDGLRFHDLRHTHVAWLIAIDTQPLEIARQLGHTKASFTQDRYGHRFPGAGRKTADKLHAWIADTPPRHETPTVALHLRTAR